jgi:hypothetical protein
MEQRDVAKNEHTMNIRAGLAVLKTMYMHMDEYDYIDIADTLRNMHFGTCKLHYCRSFWKAHPCNIDTIDVTTQEMGRKAYATVDFEMDGILNTDTSLYYGRHDFFGKRRSSWTCRCCRQTYILISQ